MSDFIVQPETGACDPVAAVTIVDSDNVTYSGANLTCLSINTNDSLTTALTQIEAKCVTTAAAIAVNVADIATNAAAIAALDTSDIDNSNAFVYVHLTAIQPTDTLDDILGDIDDAFVVIANITDLFNFTSNTLGDTLYFDGTDFVNTNTLFNNATNVGIGKTASFSAKFEVEATTEVGRFTRTSSDTTTTRTSLVVKHKTDANMADGFGVCIDFVEEDSTIEGNLAKICGIRDGADDSGVLAFFTYTTGVANEAMRINSSQSVGIGLTSIDASAILDVASTTKGVVFPRMTTAQRDAIGSPVAGLLIYNTTTVKYQFYNGTSWIDATGGGTDLTGTQIDNRITRGDGTGTVQFSDWFIDDAGVLYPNTDGQDIGLSGTNRIGTIFMTSTIDFGSQLIFKETGTERMKIAGSGNILIGAGTEDGSALLQLDSTTTGLLPPRMTTAQRDVVGSPASGLSVYNTTTNDFEFYNGTSWTGTSLGNNGIYTSSGSLSGATVVTMATNNLQFNSTGTSGLLTLDAVNDKVMIGQTTSGANAFGVASGGAGQVVMVSAGATGLFIVDDSAGSGAIRLQDSGPVSRVQIHSSGLSFFDGGDVVMGRVTPLVNNRLVVRGASATDSDFALRLEDSGGGLLARFKNDGAIEFNGNVGLGIGAFEVGTDNTLTIKSGGTIPTISQADVFLMYSTDIDTGIAAPHFRSEGNTIFVAYPIYGEAHFQGNVTATSIGVVDTPVKVVGTTSAGDTNLFTHTTGRLTYNGILTKEFMVVTSMSLTSAAANKKYTVYIAKNGTVLTKTGISRHVATTTDVGAASISGLVSLAENDYIEIFIENNTDTTNPTVEDLNFCVG